MIAARRKEAQAEQKQKQQSKEKDSGNNKKGNIRSGIKKTQREAAKSKKPTNAQKSVGSGKAKRNAKLANKRGISNDTKATPMEVEREVYRQQRTDGGRAGGGGGGGNGRTRSETQPRRSERNRNNKQNQNQNRSVADRNVKAKNKKQREQQQKQKQQNVVTPAPPTKKAMKAAMNALKDTGYVAPRGMKMVVSFVGSNTAKNTNSKPQGNKNQKKKESNNHGGNGNRNNNNNNGRNENGNRRGGGGRR